MTFRPALRPGASLLRRDATHLQVGTSPGIVIADQPGLVPLLHLVDGARDVDRLTALARTTIPELTFSVAEVLAELRTLGALLDASRWSGPQRRGLDAEARHLDMVGDDPDRLCRRPQFGLAFYGDAGSRSLIEITQSILTASGVSRLEVPDPDLLVIVSCGEPSRTVFESPGHLRLSHLPVVIDEDRVRIGPLVRPGHTPCVSCHDRHRGDWDRAWPALQHQLGRHTAIMTPPGLSALTSHAAAVELAAGILAHVDGAPLPAIGRSLVVGPRHDERTAWPVAFHHGCGCDLLRTA